MVTSFRGKQYRTSLNRPAGGAPTGRFGAAELQPQRCAQKDGAVASALDEREDFGRLHRRRDRAGSTSSATGTDIREASAATPARSPLCVSTEGRMPWASLAQHGGRALRMVGRLAQERACSLLSTACSARFTVIRVRRSSVAPEAISRQAPAAAGGGSAGAGRCRRSRSHSDRHLIISDRRGRLPSARDDRTLVGVQINDIHLSIRSAVDDAIARTVAIGALVAIALVHVLQLPDAFAAIGYLGALFIGAVAACLLLAAVMTRTGDDRAWAAAGGLAALILLCYVISRSIGLPGFTDDTGEWSEAPGLASMVVEGLLVFLTVSVLMTAICRGCRLARPSAEAGPGFSSVDPCGTCSRPGLLAPVRRGGCAHGRRGRRTVLLTIHDEVQTEPSVNLTNGNFTDAYAPAAARRLCMTESGAVIDHLVARLALGRVRSVAFVVPGDVTCTLRLYDVAIKTARSGWRIGVPHALYWFVTPEPSPLACYGAAMTAAAHQRLEPEGGSRSSERHTPPSNTAPSCSIRTAGASRPTKSWRLTGAAGLIFDAGADARCETER
jgi:hypothetical protein